MDVTPQLIEQIEFSEKFRGYDPDQVDDFLERVGAALSESQARAADLEHRVRELERQLDEAPARTPEPVAQLSDDEEIEQATRTLMLAKRTAEAAISEARAEANQLLADARATAEASTRGASEEADRLVRDAQAQREELLRQAKVDAEGEFAGQREQHQSELTRLADERRTIAEQLQLMEARLDEQRNRLETTVRALQQLLEDPAQLGDLQPLDVDTSAIVAGGAVDPSAVDPAGGAARSPFYSTGAVAAVRVPDDAVSVVDDVPDGTGNDPWGPGSWAEVANDTDEPEDEEPSLFDRGEDVPEEDVVVDEPTQAYSRYEQDDAQAGSDEAMRAFFESEEPASGRRFGRRR